MWRATIAFAGALILISCSSEQTSESPRPPTITASACHGVPEGIDMSNPDQPIAAFSDGIAVGQREATVFSDGSGGVREVMVWKGLRYGNDTGGDNRWRRPVRASCEPSVQQATAYPTACLQSVRSDRNSCPPVGSEDCLFLNVFVPDPQLTPEPAGGYPVMVWIHGGNFEWGSSGYGLYHAHNLAAWGVVVVTINYRVGTMGFLAHDAFRAENAESAAGNYGLMDQVTALEWVRDNIRGFKGDPDSVTIFGQSAGGSSVNYHLVSPLSEGLFDRAISHSGAAGLVASKEMTDRHAESVIARVNQVDGVDCSAGDVAGCLRARSACALAAYDSGSYTPGEGDGGGTYASVDGYVLAESPTRAVTAGRQHDVALMHGIDNRDDYSVARQITSPVPVDEAGYRQWCSQQYGDFSDWICDAYPLATYGDPITAIEFQLLDMRHECSQRRLRQAWARSASAPVYAWVFADGQPGRDFANHGDELPYLFANPHRIGLTFSSAEWSMAIVMQSLWTRFAITGEPGWPAWDESDKSRLVMENDFGCETVPDQPTCESVGCKWSPSLGCGFWYDIFTGPIRDAECEGVWDQIAQVCGDGRQHALEACDDGNTVDGDGCSSGCECEVAPVCGDDVCSPCETTELCLNDCGLDCRRNGASCPAPAVCDGSGTCRT